MGKTIVYRRMSADDHETIPPAEWTWGRIGFVPGPNGREEHVLVGPFRTPVTKKQYRRIKHGQVPLPSIAEEFAAEVAALQGDSSVSVHAELDNVGLGFPRRRRKAPIAGGAWGIHPV